MSDEKNESRINIEDLPQAQQELTAEDAMKVQGGAPTAIKTDAGTRKEKHIEIHSHSWW